MKKCIFAVAVMALAGSFAGTFTWKGAEGASLSDAANWEPTLAGENPELVFPDNASAAVSGEMPVGKITVAAGKTVTITGTGKIVLGGENAEVALEESSSLQVSSGADFASDVLFTGGGKAAFTGAMGGAGAVISAFSGTDGNFNVLNLKGNGAARTGETELRTGKIYADNAALGSGTIVAGTNTFSAVPPILPTFSLNATADTVLANAILLGPEVNGTAKLYFTGDTSAPPKLTLAGELQYSGLAKIYVRAVSLECANSSISSATPTASGRGLILQGDQGIQNQKEIVVSSPVDTSGGAFWVGGNSQTRVRIAVPQPNAAALTGWGDARFVCGADNLFGRQTSVYPQNANQKITIDMNGTAQTFGGPFAGTAQRIGQVTFLNYGAPGYADLTLCPSAGHAACGYAIHGKINLTVNAPADAFFCMTNAISISGDLTVNSGMLRLDIPETPGVKTAKKIIVNAGAILDLGGKTIKCAILEMNGGKVVNGSVKTPDGTITGGDVSTFEVSGSLTKTGEGTLTVNTPLCGTPQQRAAEYMLPEGTVFFWPFDDENTMLADFGPSGYVLSKQGSGAAFAEGVKNGGLRFDGSGWLTLPETPGELPVGNNSFSVGVWMKLDPGFADLPANTEFALWGYGLLSTYHGNTMAVKLIESEGVKVPHYHNYWNNHNHTFQRPVLADGNWHHVTEVYDATAGMRYAYVDGVLVHSKRQNECLLERGAFRIGAGANNTNGKFKGWLDELIFVARAMTADEIAALYSQHVPRTDPILEKPKLKVEAGTLEAGKPVCNYGFDSAETVSKDAGPWGYDLVPGNASITPVFSAESASGKGGSLYVGCENWLKTPTYPEKMPRGDESFTMGCWVKWDLVKLAEFYGVTDNSASIGWLHFGGGDAFAGISHSKLKEQTLLATTNDIKANFYWNNWNVYPEFKNMLDGNWHFVAETWDKETRTRKTYYDNKCVNTASPGDKALNIRPVNFYVGRAMNGTPFCGWIDDAMVWPRALEEDELNAWRNLRLGKPILSSAMEVEVAENATLDCGRNNECAAAFESRGLTKCGTMTVGERLTATGTLEGDLVLADGIAVKAEMTPMAVSGKVTVSGGGVLTLPDNPAGWTVPCVFPVIVPAGGVEGGERLADWTVANGPARVQTKVCEKQGKIVAMIGNFGLKIIIR